MAPLRNYNFSITGTATCHLRFSRALTSVSNGPSVHSRAVPPDFMVTASHDRASGSHPILRLKVQMVSRDLTTRNQNRN